MENFVRLNKSEMKLVLGGTIEDESIEGGGESGGNGGKCTHHTGSWTGTCNANVIALYCRGGGTCN